MSSYLLELLVALVEKLVARWWGKLVAALFCLTIGGTILLWKAFSPLPVGGWCMSIFLVGTGSVLIIFGVRQWLQRRYQGAAARRQRGPRPAKSLPGLRRRRGRGVRES
jgi:hypothetical protein